MTRVLVVEQNPILRLGINQLLEGTPRVRLIEAAETGLVAGIEAHAPDVVLLGMAEAMAVRELERLDAGLTRVVVLTAIDNPAVLVRALAAGAHGCLVYGHFDRPELGAAVEAVARGGSFLSPPVMTAVVAWLHSGRQGRNANELTPREAEIMELISQGCSNRRIAAYLFISEKTVKNHVHQIYRRLKADNRDHAVARWRDLNEFR
ncbi:MAG: response regulator transcription factor [Streptosporangiaceae bacterium]